MFWLIQIIKLGIKSLLLHKMRSALTVLGIVFGVCSVIAMLSIGEGASQEAQERIRALGTNNIIIRAVKPPDVGASEEKSRLVKYGLKFADASAIRKTIDEIDLVTPMRDVRKDVRFRDKSFDARVIGTVPEYIQLMDWRVAKGRFVTQVDQSKTANICVLGQAAAKKLFGFYEPIGNDVKVGNEYYRVVGVMVPRAIMGGASTDLDKDVYIPLTTAYYRFGEVIMALSSGSFDIEQIQLQQINVRVKDVSNVLAAARSIEALLKKKHTKRDYELMVPLELLQQAEETKRIFNIVLGSIAGISLLVGGIGIMNIMLATITERTREIGIRRALGARKRDITVQFLVETIVLAGFGGLLGIGLGIIIPHMVSKYAEMRTVVTPESLILSFGISAVIGVLFGLYPAWRAANMDPIEALRHE
ncbi:MAG: ABC transporter permease [Planctomycetota bacterium]|nr:ABC transporter permease [Planctomycetota bacterium]